MFIGFTKGALSLVMERTRWDEERRVKDLIELAEAVGKTRRKEGQSLDASDTAISYAGVPLSFIRDWDRGKTFIMTNAEARELDPGKITSYFVLRL